MSRWAVAVVMSAAALLTAGCNAVADALQSVGGDDAAPRGALQLSPDVADAAANFGTAAVAVADSFPFPFNLAAYAAGGAAMWFGGKKAVQIAGAVCAASARKFTSAKNFHHNQNSQQNADGSADAADGENSAAPIEGVEEALPSAEIAPAQTRGNGNEEAEK